MQTGNAGIESSDIPTRQNTERFLRLMRARQQTYKEAVQAQVLQLVLVVFAPVLAGIAGLIWPGARPYVAAVALIVTVADTAWLDRAQRRKIKVAARISEQFDCELFGLSWNKLLAGKQTDPEQIDAAAQKWRGNEAELRDWYPIEVGKASPALARAICQRTNAWYDASLRQLYGALLTGMVAVPAAGFLLYAIFAHLPLVDLVSSTLAPAAPLLIWALRECFRQRDVAELSEASKAEADAQCERAGASTVDETALASASRELQNAIYARRASSPLILPFVYRLARSDREARMKAGAAEIVARAERSG